MEMCEEKAKVLEKKKEEDFSFRQDQKRGRDRRRKRGLVLRRG